MLAARFGTRCGWALDPVELWSILDFYFILCREPDFMEVEGRRSPARYAKSYL
jgi:hypothetical protein